MRDTAFVLLGLLFTKKIFAKFAANLEKKLRQGGILFYVFISKSK